MIVDERLALFNESCKVILNEANRTGSSTSENEIVDKMVTKLFKNIKKVTSKSDYKLIEATRGDLQKLENYGDLYNAEMFLYNLINRTSKERYLIETINILQNVRNNILNFKVDFMKGFQNNNALVKTTYNTLVSNYIMCLGGLIAHGISVYKDEFNVIRVSLKSDIKEKDILALIEPLSAFNELIKEGTFASTIRKYNKEKHELLNEDAGNSYFKVQLKKFLDDIKSTFFSSKLATNIGQFGNRVKDSNLVKIGAPIIIVLLAISRGAYMYYSSRILLSKYLEEISLLIEVSAQENSNPEIKAKQEKAAKTFKKLADILAVDSKVSSDKSTDLTKKSVEDTVNETAEDIKKDNEKSSNEDDDDEIF